LGLNPEHLPHIVDFVRKYRGIEFAQKAIEEKEMEAKTLLKQCPDNEARQHLEDVVGYLSGRNR